MSSEVIAYILLGVVSVLWIATCWYMNSLVETMTDKHQEATARLLAERMETEQKLFRLENSIDQEVERRLQGRISEWWPSSEPEEDVWKAEVMATKRKMINGGRTTAPRDDQTGSPSRVSPMFLRGRMRPNGTTGR